MRKPLLLSVIGVALALVVFVAHAQNAPAQNAPAQNPPQGQTQGQPTPGRGRAGADPYANNADARDDDSSRWPRRPARTATPRTSRRRAPSIRGRSIPPPGSTAPAFDPPAGAKIWNPGEAEDDAGRQGDRRHAVQRHRSGHLLRDGQRRLRLHLDRDAARPARLAGGGAHVAHLPARQGGARRARRLHRRARDPARARRRRARHRRADRRHGGGSDRGAQLDLLPAARPAQQRRRPGVRRRRCGAACPAAIATRSTTTSC